jgi:hypothetical protein
VNAKKTAAKKGSPKTKTQNEKAIKQRYLDNIRAAMDHEDSLKISKKEYIDALSEAEGMLSMAREAAEEELANEEDSE